MDGPQKTSTYMNMEYLNWKVVVDVANNRMEAINKVDGVKMLINYDESWDFSRIAQFVNDHIFKIWDND